MKTLLFPLSLWLAIASLVSPLTAQSVSKLELEKSSALNAFESVTIIPATVTINRPPIIASQPTSQFVEPGSAATLTVSATGSAPFTYQWYRGNLGVTTAPVGTNSPTFTTPALTVTTEYWVKISNAFGEIQSSSVTVTVQANTAPTGFSLIPSGSFTMGNDFSEFWAAHTVNVSAFYMAKNLVTKADWDTVRTWAISNGYSDLAAGAGKASNHPVQTVSWWDGVKYCNARSQQEGLTPVYTVSGAVMKTGTTAPVVNWAANGYRLPTEAEWEKAARGGLSGERFPWWGDTISQQQANYRASSGDIDDLSGGVNNYHPTYATGPEPYTSPVGSFAANGYGLNDMAGNVYQWCWDWFGFYDTGSPTDPRGVSSGTIRVYRGGSWDQKEFYCRVGVRHGSYPSSTVNYIGFRVARSSVP
ncbi:MAG: SUMF1/EgtB/PvdO family nonheme iron enzyme [Akkermansiaceae bacterium]|nr:SUMF1/EgtB/PvdO family nonheme iron enzyme [Akkermansiaceae bacterium]